MATFIYREGDGILLRDGNSWSLSNLPLDEGIYSVILKSVNPSTGVVSKSELLEFLVGADGGDYIPSLPLAVAITDGTTGNGEWQSLPGDLALNTIPNVTIRGTWSNGEGDTLEIKFNNGLHKTDLDGNVTSTIIYDGIPVTSPSGYIILSDNSDYWIFSLYDSVTESGTYPLTATVSNVDGRTKSATRDVKVF